MTISLNVMWFGATGYLLTHFHPVQIVLAFVLANVRTPAERRGDLNAQLSACATGATGWRALTARLGSAKLNAACDALLDYAERRVRARLTQLEGARGRAVDRLEGDGVTENDVEVPAG